ncbi:NADH-quinone oxidoreductase subunit L [Thalassobacillus sp. CUG 92003]|uniref:NADH-quinone oxidoreductase subunit L n=1 Tax=Thalassobacillus sp. CUG 92003 TaxID=2736641 RepID=UPI0015E6A81A|nr:NADH-quinone oxidoreductase subunit L [Thalassobacillus sp. CUG 92003]
MLPYAWLIPVFPFVSFIMLLAFRHRLQAYSSYIGSALTGLSLVAAIVVWVTGWSVQSVQHTGVWLAFESVELQMGTWITPLNLVMLNIVAFISVCVHIYSHTYMKDERRRSTYFAWLGLFTAAMLGLCLSPNLLQFYMCWELVGLGSFLLIGFHFEEDKAKAAAKKAFIMTRIGDIGLLAGLILLYWQTGSLQFTDIYTVISSGELEAFHVTLISLLIFAGAVGKSGQLPLHTWLPDAMEGPTPVSALIHAATMVAAGVYLVAVLHPLFMASDTALTVVAVTGGVTATVAAVIAIAQTDIKRILAYSTISQLGYMMLALGSAALAAGVFHLMTHAFFKALLFLTAGVVIHHFKTRNIHQMGHAFSELRFTGMTFLIGTLAISGFPLFSGFFSKEAVLSAVWHDERYLLFSLALLTTFLTAFYMFRLFFIVFMGQGKPTSGPKKALSMALRLPIAALSVPAIGAGFLYTPWFSAFGNWITQWQTAQIDPGHEVPWWMMPSAIMCSLAGIMLAWVMYQKLRVPLRELPYLHAFTLRGFYMDELYHYTIKQPLQFMSTTTVYIEKFVVETVMESSSSFVKWVGKYGARLQSGQVQTYGAVGFVGLSILVFILFWTGGYF